MQSSKTLIYTLLVLSLLIAGLGLLISHKRSQLVPPDSAGFKQSSLETNQDEPDRSTNRTTTTPSTSPQLKALERAVGAANGRMLYYALVRDQHYKPVPHVRVQVSLRRWVVVPPRFFNSKFEDVWLETDAHGRITYDGGVGDALDVNKIQSDSEDLEMLPLPGILYRNDLPASADRRPSQSQPQIIDVWRSNGRAGILTSASSTPVTNSITFFVDVITGKETTQPSERSDLQLDIRLKSAEDRIAAGRTRSAIDQMTIRALDGGILRTNAAFLYEAPPSGYTNVVVLSGEEDFPPLDNMNDWLFKFYISARGKFFGSVRMNISPHSEPISKGPLYIDLRSYFSPSGGRILQPDASVNPGLYNLEEISRSSARRRSQ